MMTGTKDREDGIMKKTMLFAAALLALASCTREIHVEIPDGGVTLTARTEGSAASRTIVEGDTHVYWEPGDAIKVFVGANSAQFTTDITASAATAPFTGTLEIAGGDDIWAVYPYSADAAFAEGAFTMALPAAQTARAGSFGKDLNLAIAHTTTSTLPFKNVTGGVKFSVSKTGITQVAFKGNNAEPLAGSVKVSLDANGNPAVAENLEPATEISLSAPTGTTFQAGQYYYIVALPTELPNGYSLTLTYEDGHKTVVRSDTAVEIKRSRFGTLTNVDLKAETPVPTFRITHLWLWGGTGPEYGGTKVIDLLSKPDYFNQEDNRGVTALNDNYYQIGADGSFVNYAGVDGRNWWFVYSGSVNPVDHKDIDLRKFYDVLPLSTGQFAIDGSDVTLTKADGTTVQATLVGPGTYEMPNTNPVKSVTIETQALKFTISGGATSWDQSIMYTDYHAIAGNPKVLFVELEQLPDDFIVPQASRTTDADFKYEPPVEPEVPFDWTTIPGNWNVYGGNSAPYGFWVLGGSGDDPAFMCPIEKSWDWDDTIWKESDNVLAISVTSFAGTSASGTTNWWAGNDGAFWNYTWKKTGEDLSRFYNKIPKGTVAFTLDIVNQTVTWENGATAQVLLPGDHEFVYGKTLTVPANCFALWFHLMDPIAPTADRWTDVDRFINAPLEYVIIFQKM